WVISSWRTETISSALNLMTASLNQLFANMAEPALDRRIEPPVADLDDHAGNQIRINPRLEEGFFIELRVDLLSGSIGLIGGQRHGAPDLDADAAGPLVEQVSVGRTHSPDHIQAVVPVQHKQEVDEQVDGPASERLFEDFLFAVAANGAGGKKHLELR